MADFYFKTSRFQNFLLNIPKALRIPFTFVVFIFLCLSWFISFYRPFLKSYQALCIHHANLTSLHVMHDKIEKKHNKVRRLVATKNSLIKKHQLEKDTQRCINQAVNHIFSSAQEVHLEVVRHTPLDNKEHDWFINSDFCDELHGSFAQFIQFFQLLSKKKCAILPVGTTISKDNHNELILSIKYSIHSIKPETFHDSQ